MRLKSCARRGFLVLFLQLVLTAALAAQTPADDLPAAAKEATSKGLAAAGQREWKIALRYLEEARKAAPHSPITLYNLALAESQIPGRELRAVACFEAYLLAAPEPDKAASIRSQIAKLELKTEADAGQIIDMAKQVATNYEAGSSDAKTAIVSIAVLQAHAGDADAALAGARKLLSDSNNAYLIPDMVEALAVGGHLDEAKSLAGQIGDANYRSGAYYRVLREQAKRNLLDDARSTLSQISDASNTRFALSELVKAEAQAGQMDQVAPQLTRLDEIAKGMSTKEPYAKSSRNNALYEVGQTHLAANDLRGAQAILALVFNEKGCAYHNMLEDNVARKITDLSGKKLSAGDPAGAEAIVDNEEPLELRALSYASIARQRELKNNPQLLSSLADKTQALFAAAKNSTGKFFTAIAAGQICDSRGDTAGAVTWRKRAIAVSGAAFAEPDQIQISQIDHYYMADDLHTLATDAARSEDENSLRKIIETTRAAFPKADESTRGNLDKAMRTALTALVAQTHKPGDMTALEKWVHDYAKHLSYEDIRNAAITLASAGDMAAAEKVLDSIIDTSERARQLSLLKSAQLARLFDESLKKGDFAQADKAISQMTDVSTVNSGKRTLALSRAGEGDFVGAEQNTESIPDASDRASLRANISWQREDAGDDADMARSWQQRRGLLASITDSAKRLNLYWQLCGGSAPSPLLERDLVPPFFADAMAVPDPEKRAESLRWVTLAARRAGLYTTEEEAHADAVDAIGSGKDEAGVFSLGANSAEYLEQAARAERDYFVAFAANHLALAGNLVAAQAFAGRLPADDADRVWAAVAAQQAEQGDYAAVGATQEKIADKSKKSDATSAVVHAFVKAGNLAAAEDYAEHNWPSSASEQAKIIMDVASAGEIGWASANLKRIDGYTEQSTRCALAPLQFAHGDTSGPEFAFAHSTYDYERVNLIRAAAQSGHLDLARKWMQSSHVGADQVAMAEARAGNLKAARSLVEPIKRMSERVKILRAIASGQAAAGDLAGARATFEDSSKMDRRTPPNLDLESFVGYQLVNALVDKPDFAAALKVATEIKAPHWRDQALSNIAQRAADKETAIAQAALKAINDPGLRGRYSLYAIEAALIQHHPLDALAYANLAPEDGFRAADLGRILDDAIDRGDITAVLPSVLALQDPAAKAWLLRNALRGKVFLDVKTGDINLTSEAINAVNKMPAGYWQARLTAGLARYLAKADPASAQKLQEQTLAIVKTLSGDEAAQWQRYLENAQTVVKAKANAGEAPKDDKLRKAREDAIGEWTNLLQSDSQLNAPIIIDFKGTLDGLANSVPATATNKSAQLFSNVQRQAEQLIGALKDVRGLRQKVADEIKVTATH